MDDRRRRSELERRQAAIDAFLKELATVAGQFAWRVDRFGGIRAKHPDRPWPFCPLTAVMFANDDRRSAYRTPQAHHAAEDCGLEHVSFYLVEAADHRLRNPPLRRRLLKAVDLREH